VKIFLTPRARAELNDIGDAIAADNPARAASFTDGLLAKAMHLAEYPAAFPLFEPFAHRGLRGRVHGQYVIIYRIVASTVEILHFLHGARDITGLLTGEDFDA
jgi:toxin ParE1/3/4